MKDFVTEQIGNRVSGPTGAPVSTLRKPQQRNNGSFSFCTTAIASPGICHSAITSATSASNWSKAPDVIPLIKLPPSGLTE